MADLKNTSVNDSLQLNLTPTTPTPLQAGQMRWNVDEATVDLGMGTSGTSGVIQQIGQEQYFYAKNQSGSSIANGTVVRAVGTLGNSGRILIDTMIGNGTIKSEYLMGIATQAIPNGEDGYVTSFGKIRGVDTTGASVSETWADGDILYVHPTIAGALTKVEPAAPNLKTIVALVVHANANGTLFVRPTFSSRLSDANDVQTYNPASLTAGQYLAWSTSGTSGAWTPTSAPIATNGTSGTSGVSGAAGSSGTSGTNGSSGSSGTSGTNGSSGTSGRSGTSGTSATSGTSGTSGTNGSSGSSGTSGINGAAGSSGTSGAGTISGTTNYVAKFTNSTTVGNSQIFDNGTNVGIGTASPEALLHLNQSNAGGQGAYIYVDNPATSTLNNSVGIRFGTSTGASFAGVYTGEIQNVVTNASNGASDLWFGTFNGASSGERMRITSGGNVLIGTTTSYSRLTISNGAATRSGITISDTTSASLMLFAGASADAVIAVDTNNLVFKTGATVGQDNGIERMRITSGGNVLIGTTTDGGNKLTVQGTSSIIGNIYSSYALADADIKRVVKPQGANLTTTDIRTGAIRIIFPVGMTFNMIHMKLRVYQYSTNQSFTVSLGGYNYGVGNQWINTFAYINSNGQGNVNHPIRFGFNSNNKCVIYIGEFASSWAYPQIFIDEVGVGFSGASVDWTQGWEVGFETSTFENITSTITNAKADFFYGSGSTGVSDGNIRINDINIGNDQTFGNPYRTVAFGANQNGANRIFAAYDTTDGMYFAAATGRGFYFRPNGGNTNKLVMTSGGDVGINTDSPSSALDVRANSGILIGANSRAFIRQNTGGDAEFGCAAGGFTAIFGNGSEAIRVNTNLNVLIGTTTDAGYKLRVNGTGYFDGNITAIGNVVASGNTYSSLIANGSAATGGGGVLLQRQSVTYGSIGVSGYIEGNSSSNIALFAETNGSLLFMTNGSVVPKLTIGTSGAATFSSSVTATGFFESSDSRIKSNIQSYLPTAEIAKIQPRIYTKDGKVEIGYLADDFVDILPSAVEKDDNGTLTLSYRQVHTAEIMSLKKRMEAVEEKLKNL